MLPIKKLIIIIPLLILLLGCHKTKQVSSEEITTITIKENQNILFKINNIQIMYNLTTNKSNPNPNYIYYNKGQNLIYEGLSLKKEKLQVAYIQNYKFCIYNNEKITEMTFKDCNFIYIYANKNNENIKLNDTVDVVFYNENIKLSNKFLEEVYIKWIDIYPVGKNTNITINLDEDFSVTSTSS